MISTPSPLQENTNTSIQDATAWAELFSKPHVQELLERYKSKTPDALVMARILEKQFQPHERILIQQWLAIQPKLQLKFGAGPLWLADSFAYEQSTSRTLGQWKARLWPMHIQLADLCCGMGGDSLDISPQIQVTGVDLDPKRLVMYEHNTALAGCPRQGILANVLQKTWSGDYFQIDPARRNQSSDNQRKAVNIQPNWAEISALCTQVQGALIKLPPGFDLAEIPSQVSVLYLGHRKDCLECLVLWGEFPWQQVGIQQNPSQPILAAIHCDQSLVLFQDRSLEAPTCPVQSVGSWIFEPSPTAIRSHLFPILAQELGLWQIDPQIAYLSGEYGAESPWLDAFEVLEHGPLDRKSIQVWLKRHDIGVLSIKKRGVDVNIPEELRHYKCKGSQEAVLFYTRIGDKRIALLTQARGKRYH